MNEVVWLRECHSCEEKHPKIGAHRGEAGCFEMLQVKVLEGRRKRRNDRCLSRIKPYSVPDSTSLRRSAIESQFGTVDRE